MSGLDKNGSSMPIVDMTKEFSKLNVSDQHFIKKLEKMNLDRAKDTKMLRSRNKVTGLVIGVAVIGICILIILCFIKILVRFK